MARVLVVGDIMIDVVVRLDDPFARGSDASARIVERPGGSAATFAARLARAGVEVILVARVGEGDVGRVESELARQGVIAWLKGDPDLPTGRLIAVVEPTGERSFLTDRGANDALSQSDIPGRALAGTDWLHLSGYTFQRPGPRAAAIELLRKAGETPVSLDPGSAVPLRSMGAENFLGWTAGASVLFPNADEAAALTGAVEPQTQRARLRERYPLVVIKRGPGGAEAISADAVWSEPAPAAGDVVDTTGAGDAFAAAFVAARLAGEPVRACLRQAVAAGTAASTHLGGWPA